MSAAWQVGPDTYTRVEDGGAAFAVPAGYALADRALVYRVERDSRSGKEYFINAETQKRRWTLPRVPAKSSRSMRDRVVAFYEMYNPEKVGNVDVTLNMFDGRHDELMQSLVDKYGPEPPFYPAPTVRESNRRRLVAFYERYNPEKAATCESFLDKFAGREPELFRELTRKYGPEPEAPPEGAGAAASNETERAECELRAQALLRKHRPKMLEKLPTLLQQWEGQEEGLMAMLNDRYGPEPEPGEAADGDASGSVPNTSMGGPNPSDLSATGAPPSYRDRVLALYQTYAPNKVDKVDAHLAKNAGIEEAFIAALVGKLGPEPHAAVAPAAARVATPPPTTADAAPVPADATTVATSSPTTAPPKAAAAAERSVADRVHAMYALYRPTKTHLATAALEQYAGQEEVLLDTLVSKYGPEPEAGAATPAAAEAEAAAAAAAASPPQEASEPRSATPQPAGEVRSTSAPAASEDKSPSQGQSGAESPTAEAPSAAGSSTPPQQQQQQPASPPRTKAAREAESAAADAHEEVALVALNEHPIFSTYTSSPPSVKQQLLLNFLNDREARLRDALSHNQKTQSAISDLKTTNAHLADAADTVARKAQEAAAEMEAEAVRVKEHAEDSTRLWRLEREQLVAQQRVAEVAAQRALNEARLQFEEERNRKAQELQELRRRAATADVDAREVTERSSRLLGTLEARQQECTALKAQIERLKQKAHRDLADKEVQTDRPVAAGHHQHHHAATVTCHMDAFSLHASPIPHHGGAGDASPVKTYTCARCPKRAAVSCRICRLRLCPRCDDVIHRANARFNGHERKVLPRALDDSSRSASLAMATAAASAQRSASRSAPTDGGGGGSEQLSVEDIEAQFDAVLAEHESSRRAMHQYQEVVAQLEDRIRDLRDECEQLRTTGTAPSVADEIAAREAAQTAAERGQIQELAEINRELSARVADLELQLLAQPGPAPADDDRDVAALKDEVSQLKGQLKDAKSSVREYRDEIRLLRGRLQLQMASPYGARGL